MPSSLTITFLGRAPASQGRDVVVSVSAAPVLSSTVSTTTTSTAPMMAVTSAPSVALTTAQTIVTTTTAMVPQFRFRHVDPTSSSFSTTTSTFAASSTSSSTIPETTSTTIPIQAVPLTTVSTSTGNNEKTQSRTVSVKCNDMFLSQIRLLLFWSLF